jgi:hypothetical protein
MEVVADRLSLRW